MECVFTDKDDVLIDRVIVAVSHKKVQERILNEEEGLTLDRAIHLARQYELSQQHITVATELGGPWGHVPPQNALRYPCHLGWSSPWRR